MEIGTLSCQDVHPNISSIELQCRYMVHYVLKCINGFVRSMVLLIVMSGLIRVNGDDVTSITALPIHIY